MNPDLSMGGDLLKKTGTGNLLMVFGEPDIDIAEDKDTLRVTLKGVDVYDPTTGEVRSKSTDDIACWFIDTDCDQFLKSFAKGRRATGLIADLVEIDVYPILLSMGRFSRASSVATFWWGYIWGYIRSGLFQAIHYRQLIA